MLSWPLLKTSVQMQTSQYTPNFRKINRKRLDFFSLNESITPINAYKLSDSVHEANMITDDILALSMMSGGFTLYKITKTFIQYIMSMESGESLNPTRFFGSEFLFSDSSPYFAHLKIGNWTTGDVKNIYDIENKEHDDYPQKFLVLSTVNVFVVSRYSAKHQEMSAFFSFYVYGGS
jgi:hypothetical protein